ncbi:hypothetical protein L9F63_011259, partial [Diploptera punctata]
LSLEYNGEHVCGASIISNDWAVTATHCVIDTSPNEVQFRAGSSMRGAGGTLHLAERIVTHPNFTDEPTDFDIAVVKVSVPFTYGPGVQPISMVTKEPGAGEMGTITGWGYIDISQETLASRLQVGHVPIVGHDECNTIYMLINGITEDMLCAGLDEGGVDACLADSGGPLVVLGNLAGAALIVGGEDADIENYPYQLSLEYDGEHICGGAIIGTSWVLTAAHCVLTREEAKTQFRAGSSLKNNGGTLHPAKKFYIHPNFVLSPLQNDLAVVKNFVFFAITSITYQGHSMQNCMTKNISNFKLNQSVTFIPLSKQPIELATEEPKSGEVAEITGWGATNADENEFPSQLQVVSVPIVDRQICDYDYQQLGGIRNDMICAGMNEGGKDACAYDSGGPLVVVTKQVGIVSWGIGCGLPRYPGIYSNVALLRDFVVNI